MNKDLSYYMSLDYPIEIRKIPDNSGGGYMAFLTAFPRSAIGDGETIEEAIQDLNATKHGIFEQYIEEGVPIPEPEPLYPTLAPPSGKFVTRMDPVLHSRMIHQAESKGISRNQYAVNAISEKVERDETAEDSCRRAFPRWRNAPSADTGERITFAGTSSYANAA